MGKNGQTLQTLQNFAQTLQTPQALILLGLRGFYYKVTEIFTIYLRKKYFLYKYIQKFCKFAQKKQGDR